MSGPDFAAGRGQDSGDARGRLSRTQHQPGGMQGTKEVCRRAGLRGAV